MTGNVMKVFIVVLFCFYLIWRGRIMRKQCFLSFNAFIIVDNIIWRYYVSCDIDITNILQYTIYNMHDSIFEKVNIENVVIDIYFLKYGKVVLYSALIVRKSNGVEALIIKIIL